MFIKVAGKVYEVVQDGGHAVVKYVDHVVNQPIMDANHTQHLLQLLGLEAGRMPIETPMDVYGPLFHAGGKILEGLGNMVNNDPYLIIGGAVTWVRVANQMLHGGLGL